MVAFNFQKQFVEPIEAGIKDGTIRDKLRCKAGDKLQLYYGQRTKYCRKISDAVCVSTWEVLVTDQDVMCMEITPAKNNKAKIKMYFGIEAREQIAKEEGFTCWEHMRDWFKENKGLPYTGYLAKWELEN